MNPKRSELLGIKCYPSVAALSEPVDLAVIVTPAATVPGVVRECVDAGARSAIVISAGFKERGASLRVWSGLSCAVVRCGWWVRIALA